MSVRAVVSKDGEILDTVESSCQVGFPALACSILDVKKRLNAVLTGLIGREDALDEEEDENDDEEETEDGRGTKRKNSD